WLRRRSFRNHALVTVYQIRIAHESAHRAANAMFRGTMHEPPIGDDRWERVSRAYQPNRLLAAFEGDDVIGTPRSVDSAVAVPGGKQVPIAAVEIGRAWWRGWRVVAGVEGS